MELLIKIAAIAVICAVLGLVLRKISPETAILLTMSAACTVLYFAADVLTEISDFLKTFSESVNIAPASISAVLKVTGIAVISKLASDICADAGQKSVSSAIEIFASAASVYVALPIIKTVFQMINSFI